MAIFFAIITLFGWGIGDVFIAIASKKIGDKKTLFYWLLISFILSLLYLPFAPKLDDWMMFGLAALIKLVGLFGVLLYFRAFEMGNASLAGVLSGSYALVTVPLSVIFFGEKLTSWQIGGIVTVFVGMILASLKEDAIKEIKTGKIFSDPAVPLALGTMVLWGLDWTFVRIPVERIGWFWAGFPIYLFFMAMPIVKMVKISEVYKLLAKRSLMIIIFCGALFTVIANYSFNLGVTYGYSSIVAPIAGLSPVVFVILAHFVFKEKLTGRQKAGIIFSLLGIALISFGPSSG